MKGSAWLAVVGAPLALLACGDGAGNVTTRADGSAAADRNGAEGTTIRADMNGIRANIDLEGTDVRVGREGVSVNLDGGEIRATIRTGDNASVSLTTNQQ